MMIEILKLLVICFILSDLASFIGELIDMSIITKKKSLGVIKSLSVYLLTCPRCFSMWFSLIWTGDLFTAASVAGIIFILIEIWNRLKIKETKL